VLCCKIFAPFVSFCYEPDLRCLWSARLLKAKPRYRVSTTDSKKEICGNL
jgi:hypothetical protein